MPRENLAAHTVFASVACRRCPATARNIGLLPSTVSHANGKLGAHLDVRLLGRTPRSFALTEAGQTFLGPVEMETANGRERAALRPPAGVCVGCFAR